MSYEVKKISNVESEIKVTISTEQIEKDANKQLKLYAKTAKMKGFRPGKVPFGLVKKMYGKSVIEETGARAAEADLLKAMTESEIPVIGEPISVDVESRPENGVDKDYVLVCKVETRPEIPKLADIAFGDFELERVTMDEGEKKENVENRLEGMARQASRIEDAAEDAAVAYNSLVQLKREVDASEKDDKDPTWQFPLIEGEIEDAIDPAQILGKKVGDKFPMTTKEGGVFDDAFNGEWELEKIQTIIKPELNDDFAKDMGDYDSLDALRSELTEQEEERFNEGQKAAMQADFLKQLEEKYPLEMPPHALEKQIEAVKKNKGQGDDEADPEATARTIIHNSLMMESFGADEAVEVTDADVEADIEKTANAIGLPKEQIFAMFAKDPQMKYRMERDTKDKKIFDYVLEKVKIKDIKEKKADADKKDAPAKKKTTKKKAATKKKATTKKADADGEKKPAAKKKAATKKKTATKKTAKKSTAKKESDDK